MSTSLRLDDVGFTETATAPISVEHTELVARALDRPGSFPAGSTLPLLWHWTHFTPRTATADLGDDGHPPLPAAVRQRYPRRMWASGRVEAPGRLLVGEPAERRSRITDLKESDGRSGPLLIVTVEHVYRQFGADQVLESQTLVYKTQGPALDLPVGDHRPEVGPDQRPGQWAERRTRNRAELFRFSAITFNSHRIHYDADYARSVEGYPALVVHGPLTAITMATAIADHAGRDVDRFEFRGKAPLFVDVPFTIVGAPDGDQVTAQAIRNDAAVSMEVTARLAPPVASDPGTAP